MSSLVTNLYSSTAQKIVNWVTTADGCVHTAYVTQLDSCVTSAVCVAHTELAILVGDSLDESEQICQQQSRVTSCRRCECTRQQS